MTKIEQDALAKYPLLKSRCLERRTCGVISADEIESHIVDAVNGIIASPTNETGELLRHLIIAHMYAVRIRNGKAVIDDN